MGESRRGVLEQGTAFYEQMYLSKALSEGEDQTATPKPRALTRCQA